MLRVVPRIAGGVPEQLRVDLVGVEHAAGEHELGLLEREVAVELDRGEPHTRDLVLVAPAHASEHPERGLVLGCVEGEREAAGALDELLGVALRTDVDGGDVEVPEHPEAAPADRHGVHALGVPGGEQGPVAAEPLERVECGQVRLDGFERHDCLLSGVPGARLQVAELGDEVLRPLRDREREALPSGLEGEVAGVVVDGEDGVDAREARLDGEPLDGVGGKGPDAP